MAQTRFRIATDTNITLSGEQVEADLDRLITKRHDQRTTENGHRPSEELYEESCRRHAEQRQASLAWEWLRYHVARQRAHRKTFALLDAHHEAEIRRYEELLGLDHEREESA